MAETTGVASGARTLRAVNARACWPGSGSGGHSGRRLADPVWVAAGEGPAAVVTHSCTALVSAVNRAAELRLCPNPPQPYAHIVILAAQKAANRHK